MKQLKPFYSGSPPGLSVDLQSHKFLDDFMKTKTPQAPSAPIEVIVPESKRMEAILALSHAVKALAQSLHEGHTKVNMQNISITCADTGISVKTVSDL